MDENNNKNNGKKKITDEEIEKAQKEMEELMKNIQEEMGNKNVKVIKLQLPQPTIKNFITGLLISLLLNALLIIGTSGFIDVFEWNSILDLLYFSIYFTFIERTINFIFKKIFMPLIIRTMGIASLIPYLLSIALVLIFPLFVTVNNIFTTLLVIIFICLCRNKIVQEFEKKSFFKKRRKK